MRSGILRAGVFRRLPGVRVRGALALLACTVVLMAMTVRDASAQEAHGHEGHAVHHSVHLNWAGPKISVDKVAGYNIYRSVKGGKKFRKLNRTPVPEPEYDDTTVRSGKTYVYRVKSVDAMGRESGPSNQFTLKVP